MNYAAKHGIQNRSDGESMLVAFRISSELKAQALEKCEAEDLTFSHLIRRGIRRELDSSKFPAMNPQNLKNSVMRRTIPINLIICTVDAFSRRALQSANTYRLMMALNCGLSGIEFATQMTIYQDSAADLAIASGLATGLTHPVTHV